MKIGGTLRALVPDLQASKSIYKKDKNFFKFSKHYDESLELRKFFKQIISRWTNYSNK